MITKSVLPHPSLAEYVRLRGIPYYLGMVHRGLDALDFADKFQSSLDMLEICIAGKNQPVERISVLEYATPVVCMAAMSCRLLLEFVGLRSKESRLIQVDSRRNGDIGIEHYDRADGTPLIMISPSIVDNFADPPCVERAWVTVYDFASQRLAHLTDGQKLPLDVNSSATPIVRRAFETIPQVVKSVFLDATSIVVN